MNLSEAFGAWHAHPQPNLPVRKLVLDAMRDDAALVTAMKEEIDRLEQDRGGKKLFEADYLSGQRHKALREILAASEGNAG